MMFQMLFRRRNYKSSEEQARPRAGGRNRGRTVRHGRRPRLIGLLAAVRLYFRQLPAEIFYEQHYQQSTSRMNLPDWVGGLAQ